MADNILQEYLIKLGFKVEKKEELDNFIKDAEAAAKSVAKLGVAAVGGLGLVAGMTYKAAESMEQLYYQAQRAGADPFKFRAMATAAEQVGVKTEQMANMLANMGEKLRTDPGAVVYLHGLGIQAKDSTEAIMGLLDYMDKMRAAHPGQDDTITRAYGNQFAQMLGVDPGTLDMLLANEGRFREAIKTRERDQAAAGITSDSLKQSVETMNALRASTEQTKLAFASMVEKSGVLPMFTQALNETSEWFRTHPKEIQEDVKAVADAFRTVANVVGFVYEVLQKAVTVVAEFAAKVALFIDKPSFHKFLNIFGMGGDDPNSAANRDGQFSHLNDSTPNPRKSGTSVAKSVPLDPKQLASRLARDLNLSEEQAAALVGNLMQESGLDPAIANKTSGAFGIAQWLSPSRLADFKQTFGHDIHTAGSDEQVRFLEHELKGSYSHVLQRLRGMSDLRQEVELIRKAYEAPGEAEANDAVRFTNAAGLISAPLGGPPAAGGKGVNVTQNNNVTINAPSGDAHAIAQQQVDVNKRHAADASRYFVNGSNR